MLQIINNDIVLTRGDTLTLTVTLKKDGNTYTPEQTDVIRFALSKCYLGEPGYKFILEKIIPNDTLTFTLTSEETKIAYGEYRYDLEIIHGDGCVDTFISAKLRITGEVK